MTTVIVKYSSKTEQKIANRYTDNNAKTEIIIAYHKSQHYKITNHELNHMKGSLYKML
jgi:hypothetical protein